MLFSKTCRSILFFTSLLSANAETIRGAQQERELTLTTVEAVNLGSAGNYTILTKSGISAVAGTAITGDIAVSPIAATGMTGFGLSLPANGMSSTSSLVTEGTVYASDYAVPTPALLTTAISDMEAAYTDAAGRTNSDNSKINLDGGLIGGLTLEPGVYTFATNVDINSDVTLEGTDVTTGPTDIFIIQMTGDLMLAADMKVILTKGVLAKNVFWQVAGAVEVRAGATMKGILLVQTDVTFVTGSTLNGRVLAQTACVLQKATITPA